MKTFKSYRWAGLLLVVGAISVALVPPLEDYYNTEGGLPGFLFTLWFICNSIGMIGLSFFYSSTSSKMVGWINFIGLISLYAFWVMVFAKSVVVNTIAWVGIGFAFILFAVSGFLSNKIYRWVVVVWILAGIASFAYQALPKAGLFSFLNWWLLGLALAPLGVGIFLLRQPQLK